MAVGHLGNLSSGITALLHPPSSPSADSQTRDAKIQDMTRSPESDGTEGGTELLEPGSQQSM